MTPPVAGRLFDGLVPNRDLQFMSLPDTIPSNFWVEFHPDAPASVTGEQVQYNFTDPDTWQAPNASWAVFEVMPDESGAASDASGASSDESGEEGPPLGTAVHREADGLYLELNCTTADGLVDCNVLGDALANASATYGVGLQKRTDVGYGQYRARLRAAQGAGLVTAVAWAVAEPALGDDADVSPEVRSDAELYRLQPHFGLALEIWGSEPEVLRVAQYWKYPQWEPEVAEYALPFNASDAARAYDVAFHPNGSVTIAAPGVFVEVLRGPDAALAPPLGLSVGLYFAAEPELTEFGAAPFWTPANGTNETAPQTVGPDGPGAPAVNLLGDFTVIFSNETEEEGASPVAVQRGSVGPLRRDRGLWSSHGGMWPRSAGEQNEIEKGIESKREEEDTPKDVTQGGGGLGVVGSGPPPPPVWHFVRLWFLYGALGSHPLFPSFYTLGRCFLTGAGVDLLLDLKKSFI